MNNLSTPNSIDPEIVFNLQRLYMANSFTIHLTFALDMMHNDEYWIILNKEVKRALSMEEE
jgi:hypothetical protein